MHDIGIKLSFGCLRYSEKLTLFVIEIHLSFICPLLESWDVLL